MSSWYSNLVTKTSSQISNLRSTLLSSEADGDTEDDTHVCRVLRNYYTEKGRSFPNWLPPDPRAPPPQMTQAVYAQPQVGSRYGGLGGSQQAGGNGGGGLSSLWDNGPAQQQQQQPQVPQSLRAGRPATTQPGGASREEILRAQAPRSGSYSGPGGPAPAAGSAQDRLKQRLWGTRTTSPSSGGSGPFQPPPNGGGGGGGGHQSQNSYEDRFAPGGSYDNARGSGGGGGGGGYQPFVGSNAPWSSDGGPAGGGRATNGVQRKGLPSGPRGYR